jgi:GNAT superfamily N-acetyltransferase
MLEAALFGANPRIFATMAENEAGVVQGFALWFLNYSTWEGVHGIYLEDLYVKPEARGAGHGKALLQHLAATAVDRGYARVEWSVLDWNEPSISFYKNLGAAPMAEWSTFRLTGPALESFGTSRRVQALG